MDPNQHEPDLPAPPESATPAPVAAEKKISRRQMLINIAIGGGGLALLIAALFSNRWRNKDDEMAGLSFVIPEGAGAEVNNSTLVSAITLPTDITFEPGEEAAISVKNEDSVPLRAGPFVILPGQTYTQRFPNPGEFFIACTVDPAESITVTVLEG
ncbi:MAG: hypothetical protein KC438_03420 [Thermomicrobiales bacterium]|nr:hypothetical protein [Thermomicrobiales bacterium]MCO5221778.1 hypothetical protein [Thermomicrobiales bacterium]